MEKNDYKYKKLVITQALEQLDFPRSKKEFMDDIILSKEILENMPDRKYVSAYDFERTLKFVAEELKQTEKRKLKIKH